MKKHENLILILLVVALVVFPLIWKAGSEFGGADDQVKDVVAEINPEYKPWFKAIWSPPSAEVESFLFALQAAAGAGFIGYWIGFQRGRRSTRTA
ncbi:MAG: energy-coupling factor ABC transporter substrate-binding protein [Negativicutes bacterium]